MNIDYDSLFCFVDDFCKGFENWYKKTLITSGITPTMHKNLILPVDLKTVYPF